MFVGGRVSGIGNRSDFAARFGVRFSSGPGCMRGASGKFATTAKSDGVAMALIETSVPKPARQQRANHTVLCMLGPKVWRAGRYAHPRPRSDSELILGTEFGRRGGAADKFVTEPVVIFGNNIKWLQRWSEQ